MYQALIILFAAPVLEGLAGTWLGAKLRKNRSDRPGLVIAGFCFYLALCLGTAFLAVQYPGPASRYGAGSSADHIRTFVIGPAQLLWIMGPFVSALSVAGARTKRLGAEGSPAPLRWYLQCVLISCLSVPFWLVGLIIHGAHYAGAWL